MQEVTGSIPVISTRKKHHTEMCGAFLVSAVLNSLSHGLRRDSSLGEGAFGITAKFLAQAQSFRECSLPLGGAVAQRLRGYKWRSEKSVKAIAPTGAALAFLCFDFFFRIVKGVQPLTRCGVGGVQR